MKHARTTCSPARCSAIRRNGGILGKLQVGDVSIEGAIANPVAPFTEAQPQVGDELILDEVLKLANLSLPCPPPSVSSRSAAPRTSSTPKS